MLAPSIALLVGAFIAAAYLWEMILAVRGRSAEPDDPVVAQPSWMPQGSVAPEPELPPEPELAWPTSVPEGIEVRSRATQPLGAPQAPAELEPEGAEVQPETAADAEERKAEVEHALGDILGFGDVQHSPDELFGVTKTPGPAPEEWNVTKTPGPEPEEWNVTRTEPPEPEPEPEPEPAPEPPPKAKALPTPTPAPRPKSKPGPQPAPKPQPPRVAETRPAAEASPARHKPSSFGVDAYQEFNESETRDTDIVEALENLEIDEIMSGTAPLSPQVQALMNGSVRALLVEAEQGWSDMRFLLEHRGVEVVTLADPRRVPEFFGTSSFDILIVDVELEGVDGAEFAKLVRGVDSSIPLVALHIPDPQAPAILKAGFDATLSSVVDEFAFERMLTKCLTANSQ